MIKSKFLFKYINFFYLILLGHLGFWLLAPRIPYPHIIPENIDVSGLIALQNFDLFFTALLNTIIIAALVNIINLIFALPIALMLSKNENKLISIISGLLYIPLLAPILLPAFGLYEFFIRLDLIGTHLSVAMAQSTILFPYMLKPMENYLRNKGYFLEMVAADLGESKSNIFLKITLPGLMSPIMFGSFLCIIGSFNDYVVAFLVGDLNVSTLSVILYPLIQSDNRITSIVTILFYVGPLILMVLYMSKLKLLGKNGNLYART